MPKGQVVEYPFVTMRTFSRTPLAEHRHRRRSGDGVRSGEDGFLLIEVMMSALLVGLIVVSTFTGFDVATRISADQRHHDQAVLLAAQSQDQLRSDPATALDALETNPHKYTVEVGGTKYTVTQEAKPVGTSGGTGCNTSETGSQVANVQITSSVTYPQLEKAGRPVVKASGIVTPPIGSAIEVDVTDGGSPEKGVAGITAIAKFTPVEAAAIAQAEGTTGSAGCVVLGGLPATTATVEIAEKTGFVTTERHPQVPHQGTDDRAEPHDPRARDLRRRRPDRRRIHLRRRRPPGAAKKSRATPSSAYNNSIPRGTQIRGRKHELRIPSPRANRNPRPSPGNTPHRGGDSGREQIPRR